MMDDPSANQSAEEISAYYTAAKEGDKAAIRETQYRQLRFIITEIDNVNPRLGRLYVKQGSDFGGSAFYRKTGKSCFIPKGQTSLVIPTPEVLRWVEANPDPWKIKR
jgi:hypothetical protein